MPSRDIENRKLIPALNNLAFLIQWLKPGVLSFRVSQIKSACEPDAVRVQKEHQALIDDHCQFEQASDDKPRTRKTRVNSQGQTVYDMGTKEKDFDKKFDELMSAKSTISVTRWLTFADVERVEKERVQRLPKGADGKEIELQPVDWSALECVMDVSDDKEASKPVAAKAGGGDEGSEP